MKRDSCKSRRPGRGSSDEEMGDDDSQDEKQDEEQKFDDEFEDPPWFTEMEKIKEKCAGCYFLANQVARIEHEFKAELEQKSKVNIFKMPD